MPDSSTLDGAYAAFGRGDLHAASELARRDLEQTGGSAATFLLLARIATEHGEHADAERLADRGLALDARSAACLAHRGFSRLRLGEREAARGDAVAVLDLATAPVEALDLACVTLHALGAYAEAARAQARAVAIDPDNPALLTNLGSVLVICGDIPGATEAYRRAIDLAPANARALAALSEVRTATPEDNNVPLIGKAIDACGDAYTRLVLHHALAREQEALGNLAEAMAALQAGKAGMVAAVGADPRHDRDMFASLHRAYGREPARCGNGGGQAIFVLGMPRSGTTVVERIVSALPGVASLGESPLLPGILRQALGSRVPAVVDAQALEQGWGRLDAAAVGDAYLHHAGLAAGGARRWVDKLPLNLLLAGAIIRALPQARIVWVSRNPMDAALGNFRQMFEYRSGTYDYNLSLPATAEYIADAEALRQALERRFPGSILSVRLEELIASPRVHAQRIAEFCRLEWDEACIEIERNAAPAGSASAVEVREPIHSRYIGRWRRYQDFMEPAQAVFRQRGLSGERD